MDKIGFCQTSVATVRPPGHNHGVRIRTGEGDIVSTKDFEVEEGKEVVRRTIVGGRPRARRKRKTRIPIGIEKVLCRAVMDPGLRLALLENRAAALSTLHDEISPTEREILTSIPKETLALMIDRIDIKRHSRKRFMKGIVAASVVALTSYCSDSELGWAGGAEPDWPDTDIAGQETVVSDVLPSDADTFVLDVLPVDVGAQADVDGVSDMLESEVDLATQGIRPDEDIEEPDVVEDAPDLASYGITPDVYETEDMMAPTGITPDAE